MVSIFFLHDLKISAQHIVAYPQTLPVFMDINDIADFGQIYFLNNYLLELCKKFKKRAKHLA